MLSEAGCSENINKDDTFKILIATDIHLGFDYNKKRGKESEDSFVTFEEILQHGQKHEVDFILLGGDLFHDAQPSQSAIMKCMNLLRKYCLGTREIKVQFLSDPNVAFQHCAYKTVNYEDPNLNVSMPVFSIHGNHDDPNFGTIGSMDLLSVSGLVNYFGKWTDLAQITITPLIMKKGKSHLALYGLSYINDQRLSRLLRDFKVDMLRPEEIPDCFNIFVLHQNRVEHKEYAYIPQNQLPNFLNLIIWGHEHECRITPEFVADSEYFISQPGSSIATSLCEGEAKLKHIGILSINGLKYKIKKIRLQTVRPFVFDNLILQNQDIHTNYIQTLSQAVYNYVDDYIESVLIPKAAEKLTNHPKQPIQPLLRLRIFYSNEEELFDETKLGQKYCDEIANPMNMIVFRKEKKIGSNPKLSFTDLNDECEDMAQALCYNDEDPDWKKSVQGGIKKYFSSEENKDVLTVLTVNGLNEALNRFVGAEDVNAFENIINHQMKKTIAHLETCDVETTEDIIKEIKSFRDKKMEEAQEEIFEIQNMFNTKKVTKESLNPESSKNIENPISSDEDNEPINKVATNKQTRGKGVSTRGKGSRGGCSKTKVNVKSTRDVTITSRASTTTKETKKQDQNTIQTYVDSSMNKTKPSSYFLSSDDSD